MREYLQSPSSRGPRVLRWSPRHWIGGVLLLSLVCLAGCGGCGGSSEPLDDPSAAWGGMGSREAYMAWKKEQEEKEETKKPAKKQGEIKPPAKNEDEAAAEPNLRQEKKPVSPQRTRQSASSSRAVEHEDAPNADRLPPPPRPPSDLLRWQERDFFVAKLLEKPELLEVIARSAVDGRNDERIVRILTHLLQPKQYAGLRQLVLGDREESESGRNASRRRRTRSTRESRGEEPYSLRLIDASVDALAQNTTPAARRTLAQLIVGKLDTEDNVAAATAALDSLAARPTRAHEDMLFRIAVDAEQLVETEEPPLSPADLSSRALEELAKKGSSEVRVRMAKHLMENAPSLEIQSGLERVLSDLTPENLEAHVALYMGASDPKPTRQTLAQHFAACSSEALQLLLSLDRHGDAQTIDQCRHVARLLWAGNFALAVEGRLNRLDSWNEDPALLSLALSLPSHTMRVALAEKLDHQWAQGPNADSSNLIAAERALDPGLLAVLRAVSIDRIEPPRLPSFVGLRSQRVARGRSTRSNSATLLQQQQQVDRTWADLAGKLALDWCNRCRTAAHDRDAVERARGRQVEWSEGIARLPIKLHSNDGITAAHHATWGRDASTSLGVALDPLSVQYVRIEERTRPARLLAYYDRILPEHKQRVIEDGVCFEGILDDTEPGYLCSADVRITRAAPEVRRLPEQEQDLVVEILVVTIRNPGLGPSSTGK